MPGRGVVWECDMFGDILNVSSGDVGRFVDVARDTRLSCKGDGSRGALHFTRVARAHQPMTTR